MRQALPLLSLLLALPLGAQSPRVHLRFLGAARFIGGSAFLLTVGQEQVLLDCGAPPPERKEPLPPLPARTLRAVLLSHVHLDHLGRLPTLNRRGFRGPVHATAVSCELAPVLLRLALRFGDFGVETFYRSRRSAVVHSRSDCPAGRRIRRRNRETLQAHRPQLEGLRRRLCKTCLQREAAALMGLFRGHPYGRWFSVTPHLEARFLDAGHVPGSAMIQCRLREAGEELVLLYSGDYGNALSPFLRPPVQAARARVLIVESTYGDRVRTPPPEPFASFVARLDRALRRDHLVVVPAYVFDRTQKVLHVLGRAMVRGRLRRVPVFVASATARTVTSLYARFHADPRRYGRAFAPAFFRRPFLGGLAVRPWKPRPGGLAKLPRPAVLFVAPADGRTGVSRRVVQTLADDEEVTFALVGYADPASPVGQLRRGARTVRFTEGGDVPVRARVVATPYFSGHADQARLLALVAGVRGLAAVFVVHGEGAAAAALAARIRKERPELRLVTAPPLGACYDLRRLRRVR